MIEQIQKLIGKSYNRDTYNCWHLVMELVPTAPSVEEIGTLKNSLNRMNQPYSTYIPTDTPRDGDIVLLGRSDKEYYHAGVYYQGKVVHALDPSVVFQPLDKLRRQFRAIGFYTCESS